ncbi:NAD(P)-dependent dehydrogenase (short-subunit alcohol dehydrogenase family) [Cytobacillus oceanisediminis]|uniref:NAD(P)-dependent dehydrogenase (Short-subunit alcohol dehydrogenase family) n=1 Tax=Cytobacillus oceanisediminis TaxID=665099 RepID=A0A2V2ZX23_9BACI|nr:NAD(P)-dependent dehydrogenase (short-subunit alcohol dehydrogenase family) [Cytobacillus oceanisediminis]
MGINADVLNIAQLTNANEIILNKLGPCDILINGAGGNHPKGTTTKEYFNEEVLDHKENLLTFFDLDAEGMEFVINLNFLGTILPTQIFAREMIGNKEGVILNISSMNAFTPLIKIPAYSGAKASINNFTQWLAVHISKVGIRVNAISTGFFLTGQNEKLLLNEDGSYTERAKKIFDHTPMGRFGKSEELIGTLLWLIDHNSTGFVNGLLFLSMGVFQNIQVFNYRENPK